MIRRSWTPVQKEIRRRILEISHRRRLPHLGSNLSAVDLISAVYEVKSDRDRFVLSSGHAGIALYAVLEANHLLPQAAIDGLNIHPDRDPQRGIDVSTGSLGQGLSIAVGMALARPHCRVFCLVSDGECAEGSIWEALRIAREFNVRNLAIIFNANGWAAYRAVDSSLLLGQLRGFGYRPLCVDGHDSKKLSRLMRKTSVHGPLVILAKTCVEQLPFLIGQDAHYYVMNDVDYQIALEALR